MATIKQPLCNLEGIPQSNHNVTIMPPYCNQPINPLLLLEIWYKNKPRLFAGANHNFYLHQAILWYNICVIQV